MNIGRLAKIVRLALAERIIPRGYFVQGEPVFVTGELQTQKSPVSDYPIEALAFNKSLYGNRYAPMRDVNRWLMLRLILSHVAGLAEGDYAELGTYRGASARVIYAHMREPASLYCFDTFEGFTEADVTAERAKTGIPASTSDFSDTAIKEVDAFIRANLQEKDLILRKGFFPDSFAGLETNRWRFVHIDCDLYEPTKAGMERFWPALVPGGVIAVHDYNSNYAGVKTAVDEYSAAEKISIIPWNDRCGSAILVKNHR